MKKKSSVSVIVRTLNEEKFLKECLSNIRKQKYYGDVEIVVVDSGSTDQTISIASEAGTKIVQIAPDEFTFGRSLNLGCASSSGDVLVFISAHCIPCDDMWLASLVEPVETGVCSYVYGRQVPRRGVSKFSEGVVFEKYYPKVSKLPQKGYFCNNANAAVSRLIWEKFKFNEELTGLEDMELGKRLVETGLQIGYVSDSVVEHIHEESWRRVLVRYEREAAALACFEPSLTLPAFTALYLFFLSMVQDISAAPKFLFLGQIIRYRLCQYLGGYIGGRASQRRITEMRSEYFYPRVSSVPITLGSSDDFNRFTPNEKKQ